MTTDTLAYTVPAAAEAVACSESNVRRAINKWRQGVDDGTFPPPLRAIKLGERGLRITAIDLRDWLERWPDAT